MPITQSRMLELLDAAQDYRQANRQLISVIQTQAEHVAQGKISVEDAFAFITANTSPHLLLANAVKSEMTIILEVKHFRATKAVNARKAVKQRENRAAAKLGLPKPVRARQRPSGPKSISDIPAYAPQSPLQQSLQPSRGRMDQDPDANAAGEELFSESPDAPVTPFSPKPIAEAAIPGLSQFVDQAVAEDEFVEKYGALLGQPEGKK